MSDGKEAPPKRKRERPTCVYCERQPSTTRDHVISRALFTARPTNLITVPVCRPCNEEKARHESYFRDLLVVDLATHKHPEARAVFTGPMRRAIGRNQSRLALEARRNPLFRSLVTPQGLYLGEYPAVIMDDAAVNCVLTMMARGFLYNLSKDRIPQDYVFEINRIDPFKTRETIEVFLPLRSYDSAMWGNNVCGYMLTQASDNPGTTMWLIWFYGGQAMFLINTYRLGTPPVS